MLPGLPFPGILTVAPSCTPAGIFTLMLRVRTSVPLPRHWVQGVGTILPLPPHCGQVWLKEKTPWFWATDAGPATGRTYVDARPGFGPRPATTRARGFTSDRDRGGDAVDGIAEGLGQLGRNVGASLWSAPAPAASAAAEAGEDISEAAAKEATEIFHPHALAGAERTSASIVKTPIGPRFDQAAQLVVFLTLLDVG